MCQSKTTSIANYRGAPTVLRGELGCKKLEFKVQWLEENEYRILKARERSLHSEKGSYF